MERNSKLITKRLFFYLIPSILMIFAMQFTSLFDGVLIGNMISNEALTATSLVLPIIYIIQLPGFALGAGGSIIVANLLGKRDIKTAKKAFSISLIIGMAISIVFAILGIFVSRPLASCFSNDSYIVECCYEYILMYLVTDPILTLGLILGSFIAVDNNPKLSGAFYIVSCFAKIGLEVLLIHLMGVYGAALSTGAGYLIGLFLMIIYIKSKRRMLSFTFFIKGAPFKEVFKASSTSILNMALTAVQMLIVNIVIGQIITDPVDVVLYGLIANMVFIFDLLCGGIQNVIPNVCGILYGEKDYYSLLSVAKKLYIINIITTVVVAIFVVALPGVYCSMFGFEITAKQDYIFNILRLYAFTFFGYEISKFNMNYYPSVDRNGPSIFCVALREAIIVIPLSLIFLYTMGIFGYALACAITETATVILTYVFVFIYGKKKGLKGMFLVEKSEYKSFDVTITNELNNASTISESLTNFALENGIKERESQIVGLASEEMVNNIVSYGYRNDYKHYIDVNLKIMEDKMILRIRDDGLPFDPTKYEFDESEDYSTSGIGLIEKLTDKMSYMRLLNLNNTVFEIKI